MAAIFIAAAAAWLNNVAMKLRTGIVLKIPVACKGDDIIFD